MKSKLSLLPHIEKKYQTDVFYYRGPLTQNGVLDLRGSMDANTLQYGDVLLILDTTEGSIESARQMVTALIGAFGDHQLKLYVPRLCTGPGALLAMAADTIIMDDVGRIGQISGSLDSDTLSTKNALNGLKALRSELADVEIAAAAIGQLDLQAIGKQESEMQLAREYAAGLAPIHRQQLVPNLLGHVSGPNVLFDRADLCLWTNVIQPSAALVDFARYLKADAAEAGFSAPHAMCLASGRRAPRF